MHKGEWKEAEGVDGLFVSGTENMAFGAIVPLALLLLTWFVSGIRFIWIGYSFIPFVL